MSTREGAAWDVSWPFMKSRHSTQARVTQVLSVLLLGGIAPWASGDDAVPWPDFESRIQYAFYTEDVRALANLTELLASGEGDDPWRDYYRAVANYRLASLTAAAQPVRETAAGRCVDAAEQSVQKLTKSAEPTVVEAACLDALSRLKSLRAPLAANRSGKRLTQALRAAPTNPRALLVEASTQESDVAAKTLRKAIARFELERQSTASGPTWGGADAYLALSEILLNQGQVLPARDAAEHALLIAPEYAAARRLLERITSG